MRVHLVDNSAPVMLLGGLLKAAGNAVSAASPVAGLRIALASGWHQVSLPPAEPGSPDPELLIGSGDGEASEKQGTSRLVLLSGGAGEWEASPTPREGALLLFDVLRDGAAHVEALERAPILFLPRIAPVRRLFMPLRRFGFRIEEARDTSAQLQSLLVTRLLDLPAALCDTTVDLFLASEEGRRIGLAVLEEGQRVAEKLGDSPARLGWRDPAELAASLVKRPLAFDAARYLPDRRHAPILEAIRARDQTGSVPAQRGLVKRAASESVPVTWNWKLLGLVSRVLRAGFFRSPLELLRAVA